MRAFHDVVSDCAFQDLGWSGVPYTWDNRQSGNANVKAILDQGLVYDSFLGLFYYASVKHTSLAESYYGFVLAELKAASLND